MNRVNLNEVYKIGDPVTEFTDAMSWYTAVKSNIKDKIVDHIIIKDVFNDLATGSKFSIINSRFIRVGRLGICVIVNKSRNKGKCTSNNLVKVTLSCMNKKDVKNSYKLKLGGKELEWLTKLQLFLNWKKDKFTFKTKFNTNSYITAYNAVRDNLDKIPYAFSEFKLIPYATYDGWVSLGSYF